MANRKRKRDNDRSQASEMGLGSTLAYMRGEDKSPVTNPPDDDDGGWTVVAPKRRRQEQHKHDRSHERDSEHARKARSEHDAMDSEGGLSPTPAKLPHNPFAPIDDSANKDGQPRNPFLVQDSAIESRQEEEQHQHQQKEQPAKSRNERRKERKLERHYPAIEYSHHSRLQSHVKLWDLQGLVLYLLADGNAPQWVSVRSRSSIERVVMLMVPGLDMDLFNGKVSLGDAPRPETRSKDEASFGQWVGPTDSKEKTENPGVRIAPDDPYPARLKPDKLAAALQPLADMFEHVWPVRVIGEQRGNQFSRLHSPIHTMLTAQIPKTQEEKQLKKKGSGHKGPTPQNTTHWNDKRTPISAFMMDLSEQIENEYVPHPAMFTTSESKAAALEQRKAFEQSVEHGWVDTHVQSWDDGQVPESEIEQGSITAGRQIVSVDCEMCKAENNEFVLTRISLLSWDGETILDRLVKPEIPIKDYLTQWSGITEEMLKDVTTTLPDVQKELLQIITSRTVLVGHSLNSDLNAMKLTHPFLVDTGVLYPHPRGPPYKQSLKWLAQKFLHREVQKGTTGHDSVEDARTCLDLVKQKCEKGPAWGTGDTNAESLFKRLGRSPRPKTADEFRSGAVVDWGEPKRGHGGQAQASIGCKSDDEVVNGVDHASNGLAVTQDGEAIEIDFTWARLRELELARGWWDDAKTADVEAMRQSALQRLGLSRDDSEAEVELEGADLGKVVSETVCRIAQVYKSLPRCTAFIVYSGTGDPRAMRRLQAMHQQYRREYQTKNWDNLSVKWTDTEIQALNRACQNARNGIALIGVK